MIKFRQKEFSFLSDVVNGAGIGGTLGGIVGSMLPGEQHEKKTFRKKDKDSEGDTEKTITFEGIDVSRLNSKMPKVFRRKTIEINKTKAGLLGAAVGIIVGAALGALVSGIKLASQKINRKMTVNNRLMESIIKILKSTYNRVEGKDFVRDPKRATDLKIKVCVAISKVSGELRLAVNAVSDSKLKEMSDKILNNISGDSVISQEMTDKFNNIMITSISNDKEVDSKKVADIVNQFIKAGYPVYLVEIG